MLLSSSVKEKNEILSIDLTNPFIPATETKGAIPKDVLYFGRSKFIHNGSCYEQIRLNNYGHDVYEFELSLNMDADFKDIFEVRGIKREKRGEVYEVKHTDDSTVLISYIGLDKVKRFTHIHFKDEPHGWEEHCKALYHITLQPGEQMYLEYSLHFLSDQEEKVCLDFAAARQKAEEEMAGLNSMVSQVTTSNEHFTKWIERSQYDLLSLLSQTEHGFYPFAGVPWYNTAFGRDGIITSLQTLWLAPGIAKDALLFLAATQATESNAYQDAEPGKIIHEIRNGEMADLGEVPFKRYYGTVDATPLFIVLAGSYYRRTADIETIKEIWPNIEAALNWIDMYGDADGDGFIDYHHKSVNGLINQGWKDSHDSISDENGNLVASPIALCEVQGYVYEAKLRAGQLARTLGMNEKAEQLEKAAEELKVKFNEKFWDEELQTFVIALDGNKNPCRVVSSNAGHCLFNRIADKDKALKVAKRLLQDDMFTGWGIRTLSHGEKRYNPMSYHNGSVWPHDVAITAAGFSKYGLIDETLKLTQALFDASLFIELQRLPELFCGFTRRAGEGPTEYPVACSPQAWSVAAVFMLLEACLHIDIVAEEKKVYFYKPTLPEGVNKVFISKLQLGDAYADLELYCEYGATGVKVKNCPPGWNILIVTE
jgi:glycogen debranching enzyme